MIRLASNSDIVALRRAWGEEQGAVSDPQFETRLRAWLNQTAESRTTWVARLDGDPVGMVSVRRYDRMPSPGMPPTAWGYLGQLFVVPAHRGNGLGRDLVETVIAFADAEQWSRLVLAPSERSRPLYARAGFSPSDYLVVRQRA